jgi:hypothetical protein
MLDERRNSGPQLRAFQEDFLSRIDRRKAAVSPGSALHRTAQLDRIPERAFRRSETALAELPAASPGRSGRGLRRGLAAVMLDAWRKQPTKEEKAMANMMQVFPSAGARTTIVVRGRTYTCPVGSTITVPDHDAFVLCSNGWLRSALDGAGPTAQRPAKTAAGTAIRVGFEYFDSDPRTPFGMAETGSITRAARSRRLCR